MKTVLINGGSRGIGRAMVELFCERGYSVAFTYKSSTEKAFELSGKTGALAIKADSSVEAEVVSALKTVEDKLGTVDILINNAGTMTPFEAFEKTNEEQVEKVFNTIKDSKQNQ